MGMHPAEKVDMVLKPADHIAQESALGPVERVLDGSVIATVAAVADETGVDAASRADGAVSSNLEVQSLPIVSQDYFAQLAARLQVGADSLRAAGDGLGHFFDRGIEILADQPGIDCQSMLAGLRLGMELTTRYVDQQLDVARSHLTIAQIDAVEDVVRDEELCLFISIRQEFTEMCVDCCADSTKDARLEDASLLRDELGELKLALLVGAVRAEETADVIGSCSQQLDDEFCLTAPADFDDTGDEDSGSQVVHISHLFDESSAIHSDLTVDNIDSSPDSSGEPWWKVFQSLPRLAQRVFHSQESVE